MDFVMPSVIIILGTINLILFIYVLLGPSAPARLAEIRSLAEESAKETRLNGETLKKLAEGIKNFGGSVVELQKAYSEMSANMTTLQAQFNKLAGDHYALVKELQRKHGLDAGYSRR